MPYTADRILANHRVLFVLIVLEHDRRKVLNLNVTEHPTGSWTAQQIVESFADREAAPYLIRDRDSRYSAEVRLRIKSLGIHEILTAPKSPRQNPYAERLIGSIRRECLNHYMILDARHLKRTLASYFRYYHESRTHLSLDENCPFPRDVLTEGKIVATPKRGAYTIDMDASRHKQFVRINYWRTTGPLWRKAAAHHRPSMLLSSPVRQQIGQ